MECIHSEFTDKNPMALCDSTIDSHRDYCLALGIFDKYKESLNAKNKFGGESESESQKHLLSRYLNSAARTQLAIYPISSDLPEINQELLAQLSASKLYIIDIASGHGAGTISLINSICHLRKSEDSFPTDPLDIEIHALDFSKTALDYYKELIKILEPAHLSAGIKIKINTHIVDLTKDEEIKNTIEGIKTEIGANPQYLLICSAISGVKKNNFKEFFSNSYNYISTQFREDNSLFFWVEPQTKGNWIIETWKDLADNLKKEDSLGDFKTKNIRFYWKDPHTQSILPSDTEYFLMGLAL